MANPKSNDTKISGHRALTVSVSRLTPAEMDGAVTCIQQAFAADPYKNWAFDSTRFSTARNRDSLRTRCEWGIRNALFYVAKAEPEITRDITGRGDKPELVAPKTVLGVACWLPPALARPAPPPLSLRAYLLSWLSPTAWAHWTAGQMAGWRLWAAQAWTTLRHLGRGGLNVRRYYIWKQAQSAAQNTVWIDPRGYYFCNIVAVLPEAQGLGVGRALMDTVLARADAERRPCYLESSRAVPNIAIYERFGFRLVHEIRCADTDTISDVNDKSDNSAKTDDEKSPNAITLYSMVRDPM